MVHDEYSWEVEDGVEDEVRELSTKAIVRAGEILKLEIPLAANCKGLSRSIIHKKIIITNEESISNGSFRHGKRDYIRFQ
jgi:hypothetical protein